MLSLAIDNTNSNSRVPSRADAGGDHLLPVVASNPSPLPVAILPSRQANCERWRECRLAFLSEVKQL